MNFETEYKNIHFKISLESIAISDLSHFFGDKFHRLPNQTLIELKKGNLIPYNLVIESTLNGETRLHYWSNVLLTSSKDELMEEIEYYLEDEEILDLIESNWSLAGDDTGPGWKK